MPNVAANDAAGERARIREWKLRASGFVPGKEEPRPMPSRDVGDIISQRQSRTRWQRGTGLDIRVPRGSDEEAWLAHLALALRWADAALGAVSNPQRMADWASDDYREQRLALIVANAGGGVGLAAIAVPSELEQDVRRQLLGLDVDDLVLGYADREKGGQWVLGYAGLSEVEAEAFRCSLELRSEQCRRPDKEHRGGMRCLVEVRDMVDRRRTRRKEQLGVKPLAIETIENRLSSARGKLRTWADEVRVLQSAT